MLMHEAVKYMSLKNNLIHSSKIKVKTLMPQLSTYSIWILIVQISCYFFLKLLVNKFVILLVNKNIKKLGLHEIMEYSIR